MHYFKYSRNSQNYWGTGSYFRQLFHIWYICFISKLYLSTSFPKLGSECFALLQPLRNSCLLAQPREVWCEKIVDLWMKHHWNKKRKCQNWFTCLNQKNRNKITFIHVLGISIKVGGKWGHLVLLKSWKLFPSWWLEDVIDFLLFSYTLWLFSESNF